MPGPASALGESALDDIAMRVSDHRELTSREERDDTWQGRYLVSALLRRHSNTLTDLVGVAESFTVARHIQLRPATRERQLQNWDDRAKAWKAVGVEFARCPAWMPLRGYAEVRNAIMHGLGHLTERQLGIHREQVLEFIRSSAVVLNGDRLIVTARDVSSCADTCALFVSFLDAEAAKI